MKKATTFIAFVIVLTVGVATCLQVEDHAVIAFSVQYPLHYELLYKLDELRYFISNGNVCPNILEELRLLLEKWYQMEHGDNNAITGEGGITTRLLSVFISFGLLIAGILLVVSIEIRKNKKNTKACDS